MQRLLKILVAMMVLMVMLLPAQAQETQTSRPPQATIEGLKMVWQDVNRCSAAALTIHLSHFDAFTGDYTAIVRRLNGNAEDVSVRIEEMAAAAEEYGLKTVVRRGGTLELLKQLVAAGFPVLIENSYYDGDGGFRDWMSHNRVLIGYNDESQEFFFMDSLIGPGVNNRGIPLAYELIDDRWRAFNRDFLVIYTEQEEPVLRAVLGDYWDETYAHEQALAQAEAELAGDKADSFATMNKAWALYHLGRLDEAVAAFDAGRAAGLPWRYFWYEFTALEAYLDAERYDDVVQIVREVLTSAPGVDEMYYYIARAYQGQGNTERAIANLEAALWRNPFMTEAQDLMDALSDS